MVKFKIIFDEYEQRLEITDGTHPADLAIIDKATGWLTPLFKLENVKVISNDLISISNKEIEVKNLEIKPINLIAEEYVKAESVYLKSIEDCLPETSDYTGIHKAALNAMKNSTPVALTQSQHNRKLSLIRELEKVGNGTKNTMSIQRIEELLSYYNLDLTDLIKDELL
ncbi:MAG: hypothetical protein ACRCX8_12555 [Sarcina sp.]